MGTRIMIETEGIGLEAELNETETAQAVAAKLPITGEVNRWGEEIYFEVPVDRKLEPGARAEVEVGELGYWPTGRAFCVFFGRTPASTDEKPRAASAVTIIGKCLDDARKLSSVPEGAAIALKPKA